VGVRRRRELRLLIQNSVTVMMDKGAGHARDAAGIAVDGGATFPRIVELLATGRFLSPEASFKQENAWAAASVKSHFIATRPGRGSELS